jgi:hypothetical protein
MCWPDSIQFRWKVTLGTYISIHYKSNSLMTQDAMWPQLTSKQVHYEYFMIVFATVSDHRFQSGFRSGRNHRQIQGSGRQYTQPVNSGIVRWAAPNPSEFGGLSACGPASLALHSYHAPAFAVQYLYLTKIAQQTTIDTFLNTLQVATLAIVESKFFLLCVMFRSTKPVNSTVVSLYICATP